MDEDSEVQAVHGPQKKHISKLSMDARNKVNQLRRDNQDSYQIGEMEEIEGTKFKSEDDMIRENYDAETKKLSKRKHKLHFSSSFAELLKLG